MPIFEYDGKKYNVQDEHIESFTSDFPDATSIIERGEKKYRVKSADYNSFMAEHPDSVEPEEVQVVSHAEKAQRNQAGVDAKFDQIDNQISHGLDPIKERLDNQQEYRDNFGIGQTIKTQPKLNLQSGQFEPSYITPAGNRYIDKSTADMESYQYSEFAPVQQVQSKDTLTSQLGEIKNRASKIAQDNRVAYENKDKDKNFFEKLISASSEFRGGRDARYMPQNNTEGYAVTEDNAMMDFISKIEHKLNTPTKADKDGNIKSFTESLFSYNTLSGILDDPTNSFAANLLMSAKEKMDKGEQLTDKESMMIELFGISQNADTYITSRGGAKTASTVGSAIGQSLPFLVDMGMTSGVRKGATGTVNSAVKSAIGKATTSGAKRAILNTGKYALKPIAGAATATPFSRAFYSNAEDRFMNQYEYADGKIKDVSGGESIGRTLSKAYLDTFTEIFTESLGEGVLGKGVDYICNMPTQLIGKKFSKSIAGGSKYISDLKKQVAWNGPIAEFSEEMVSNLLSPVLTGETEKIPENFSKENLWTTFLTTAIMGVGFSSLELPSVVSHQKQLNKIDKEAENSLNAISDDNIKLSIDKAMQLPTVSEQSEALSSIDWSGMDADQMSNVANYVMKRTQGQLTRGYIHPIDVDDTAEQYLSAVGLNRLDVKDSYNLGYETVEPADMKDSNFMLQFYTQQAIDNLGEDTVEQLSSNPVYGLASITNDTNRSDNEKNVALSFVKAKQAYNGMMQRIRDDIGKRVKDSNALIDSHINQATGQIHSATMKINDRKVYIVVGNAVPYNDGSGIDLDNSDQSIMVRDAESGDTEMISPQALLSIDEAQNPEEQRKVATEAIREQYKQEAAHKIAGIADFNAGSSYTIIGDNGEQISIQITPNEQGVVDNGDETVNVSDGTQIFAMPKQVIQESANAANMARVVEFEQQRSIDNAPQANNSNFPFKYNDEFVMNYNGKIVNAKVAEAATRLNDNRALIDIETEDGGFLPVPFTPEELNSMVVEYEGVAVEQPATPIEQSTTNEDQPIIEEVSAVQQTALEQIPKSENGEPLYDQVDSDTAWDAIVEQTDGDEQMAQETAEEMVALKEAERKKIEKSKLKSGASPAEIIVAKKEQKAILDNIQQQINQWKKIASTSTRRKQEAESIRRKQVEEVAAAQKVEEERLREEREEAERIEREALNGVPDMLNDTPQDARARSYRRVNGHKVDRQLPIQYLQGNEVAVKFSNDAIPTGSVAIIDASQLQPSHIQGVRNPLHFIDEAQPKERNDEASILSAQKIASNIRPEEITSSVTAYTGAPTINSRGEVIQGNNRSDALRLMWQGQSEQAQTYKQYLMDHAEEFGLTAEEIGAVEQPILVNMLNVEDDNAIELGQYVAQDTESGGVERIKPKTTLQRMGADMQPFSNILLSSSNEESSFLSLVDSNGAKVLKWMNQKGYINPTQYRSAFDSRGNLTAEVKNDIKGIMYQNIFQGNSTRLEEMFNLLPSKAQKAILATAFRDYDSPSGERMVEEIQNSIKAYYALSQSAEFNDAKNYKDTRTAVESWKIQYQIDDATGESYLPAENFSNFALQLATMYKGESQSFIQNTFKQIYDLVQGTQEENLFEQPDNTPRTLAEAIYEVLKIEYNGTKRSVALVGDNTTSQSRRHGKAEYIEPRERVQSGAEFTDNTGGTESSSGQRGEIETYSIPQENKEINLFDPRSMTDEERQRRGFMLQNAPVVIVEKNQIKSSETLTARQAAEKWWNEHISEPVFYNTEAGEVEINKNSIESSLAHRYSQRKLDAITSLVEGFENAVYLGTMPDSRGDDVVDHYFAYPISYNGTLNYVFCRAMQDTNKNRLYVHEVFVADNIKKGDTLQTAAVTPHGGISLYRDILANVISVNKDFNSLHPKAQIEESVPLNDSNELTNDNNQSALLGINSSVDDSHSKNTLQTAASKPHGSVPANAIASDKGSNNQANNKELGENNLSDVVDTEQERPLSLEDTELESKLLTEDQINSTEVDEITKLNAIDYINGKTGLSNQIAYKLTFDKYNNDRIRSNNAEQLSTDQQGEEITDTSDDSANDDGGGRVPNGRDGVGTIQDGGDQSQRDVSAGGGSLLDNQDNVRAIDDVNDEQGDSGVQKRGSEPKRPTDRKPRRGNRSGSNGHSVSGQREQGEIPFSTERNDSKSLREQGIDEFKASLDKFKRAGKDSLSVSIAGFNSEQIEAIGEMIVAGTKVGLSYIQDKIYEFSQWRKQMFNTLAEPLRYADMSDQYIRDLIDEMWENRISFNGETKQLKQWAAEMEEQDMRELLTATANDKLKQQRAAESVEVKDRDLVNIKESLPFLFPEQHNDVLIAETQFANTDRDHAYGKGVMFTNGTGTGKTYTGLGIVKRFIKQGKDRVLVLTPSDVKVKDWIKDARNLGIELNQLADTKDSGRGAVVTTYANFQANKALFDDTFDLVMYDESHRLMQNQKGKTSNSTLKHYQVSNRDVNSALEKYKHRDVDYQEWLSIQSAIKDKINERIDAPENLKEELGKVIDELRSEAERALNRYQSTEDATYRDLAQKDVDHTKVVFLSATPFNTRENLEYVESYIFKYPEENQATIGSYGHHSPRTDFYLNTFGAGYDFKYGRLESNLSDANALSRQEIQFAETLKERGVMSGRMIDSLFDYSRDFPTITGEFAPMFNDALIDVFDHESDLSPLSGAFRQVFYDYNYSTVLFETLKTSAIMPRIKEQIANGRKVVVFHRRKTGECDMPFNTTLSVSGKQAASLLLESTKNSQEKGEKMFAAIELFQKKYAKLLNYEQTLDYSLPADQFVNEFGSRVRLFNGDQTNKAKKRAVEEFNDDSSNVDVIVVQEESGKEGISLHDTTGAKQRVLVNLTLPISPITALQIEGRTYRIGNKSNAIFEYPLLGLNLEVEHFGRKFNKKLSTTENLAMGEQSRDLLTSFQDGVIEQNGDIPISEQGFGGKDNDKRAGNATLSPFDGAIAAYYNVAKNRKSRRNREGADYYATPEPLGYMMVQWGAPAKGESVLEPSAGHGAIASFVTNENDITAIEPSSELFSKLQVKAGGANQRIERMVFEDYNIINKHDVVLMNPPFGSGGSTAIKHIAKAFDHLRDGGRIVAIIPRGSMDSKLDNWLYEENKRGKLVRPNAHFAGEIILPSVTFERAGTAVSSRVVIIDKSSVSPNTQVQKSDLSYIENISDFFDAIKDINPIRRTAKESSEQKETTNENGDNTDNVKFSVAKGVHTQTGADIFTVKPIDRVSEQKFSSYRTTAKDNNGFYSRFSRGFNFNTEDDAKSFIEILSGEVVTTDNTDDDILLRNGEHNDFTPEEQEIIDNAGDNAFKATNGEPTNLTQKQWAQVRTKAFKEWFGDWEKSARIEKLRASEPISISGKEIESSDDLKQYKKNALEYGKSLRGEYTNKDTNAAIIINRDSITEVLHHDYKNVDHLQSIAAIPQLIQNGIYIDSEPNTGSKNIEKFDYYVCGLQIEGVDYTAKFVVSQSKSGERYYDHKLTQIEKGKLIEQSAVSSTVSANQSPLSMYKDKRLISLLQTNASKVIDANGEPLVVSHSTNDEFSEFDIKKLGDNSGEFSTISNDIRYRNQDIMQQDESEPISQSKPVLDNRQEKVSHAQSIAEKLNLSNVEILDSTEGLKGKKRNAKGFYSKSAGKITIVVPNNSSVEDIEQTILHEAVAHYGLRKLFGDHFEEFLDKVFTNADETVRKNIVDLSAKNGWDFRKATEEYLATLAEDTNFENAENDGWWQKIKSFFAEMLRKLDFSGSISDNELRYILWKSYENLKSGQTNDIFSEAADIAMQNNLKVGKYATEVSDNDVLFRDSTPTEREKGYATAIYEQRVASGWYQTKEAYQDSMLALKEAMLAILKEVGKILHIEEIAGYMNPYLGENRLSGTNMEEANEYRRKFIKPMLATVAKLAPNDKEYERTVNYLMAKHGLERNEVLAKRDAQKALDKYKVQHPKTKKTIDDFIGNFRKRDYAGLTALTGFDDIEVAEVEAQNMVDDFESSHDSDDITALWEDINKANTEILRKSYMNGMIDKQTFAKIDDMFKFYIPLRGFDEKTSKDVYSYMSEGKGDFQAAIQGAYGRRSKANDPIANMQLMADSSLMQGNRNKLVKLPLLYFARSNKNDLVSISDYWVEYDEVNEDWVVKLPDTIKESDSPEVIKTKTEEFEQRMIELSNEHPEKYKRRKDAINIPYRIDKKNLREHQVVVYQYGKPIILTVNGSPRLAQAVNGLTNPDRGAGVVDWALDLMQHGIRWISLACTSLSVDFLGGNLSKDQTWANTSVWAKESPSYAIRFNNNAVRVNPVRMKLLFAKHRNGELDMNDPIDFMFNQFVINGGETGYMNLWDLKKTKRETKREIKRAQKGKKDKTDNSITWLGQLGELSRAIENSPRFAAFVTSKEMGRSLERSIWDAKEITVNFNKKGAGATFFGKTGQTTVGNVAAGAAGLGGVLYMFQNPAVQSTTLAGRLFKRNPVKSSILFSTWFALGIANVLLQYSGGDDDDEHSYFEQSPYVRRSNMLIRIGDGKWFASPLPHEFRVPYGLGELIAARIIGKDDMTEAELALAIVEQFSQILPIDMVGGGGLRSFIPDLASPLVEAETNRSWTGFPIYYETDYNENDPNWTKAYSNTNQYLVSVAKWLNDVSGGNDYESGSIDINPAKVEHLLNGYLGGIYGFADKLVKTVETIAGEKEPDARNYPIVNRFYKTGNDTTKDRALKNAYSKAKTEYNETSRLASKYRKNPPKDIFEEAERSVFFESSEYERYDIFRGYKSDIDKLVSYLKGDIPDDDREIYEDRLNELKKEMIEEMNETRK